jgi:hypothetical protein
MIKNKIEVLLKIANLFNENAITWNVGASCMLYLRDVVEDFNDIDLMIHIDDVEKVKDLLKKYKNLDRKPNGKYQTEHFLEYDIEGVDIDIMAGFRIVHNNNVHYFPLSREQKNEKIIINNSIIYLESIEKWQIYYKLMERKDKVEIINNSLKIEQ